MGRCAAKDLQLPIWICSRLAGFCRAKRFANPLGDCHPLSPGDRPDLLHFGVVESDLKPLTHDDEYNECVTTSMPPPLAWPARGVVVLYLCATLPQGADARKPR